MDDIYKLRERNKEIAARYRTVETLVANAATIEELFVVWLDGMSQAFAIPYLWVSIVDHPINERLMAILGNTTALRGRINRIDPVDFAALVPRGLEPVLAGGELRPFFRMLPSKNKYFIRSIAVAPFHVGERIVGSLNHGDHSPHRYEPDMDTHLLKRLVARFSERLTYLTPLPAASE